MGLSTKDLATIAGLFNNQDNRDFGKKGGIYIDDTNVHTFRAQAIKCSAASAVRFTSLKTVTGDDMTGMELLAGDVIYGDFTEIQIDTGSVYAYSKS